MSPRERLLKIQDELKARGVVDIKFAWSPNVRELTLDQVTEDVCEALQAYLDGRYHPMLPLNDSVRC